MFNWDDLRVFIATARAGSSSKAAQSLGIDVSTVNRRIAGLESALKAMLFVRSSAGLQLTATGARLLDAGADAEAAMASAERIGQPDIIAGTIRISASEGFGGSILAPALPELRRRHPGLDIELIANAGFMSPLKREVDMAITLSAPESVRLHVEPLTDYELGLFGSPAYLAAHRAPEDRNKLHDHTLVGYVEDQIYAPELRYLEEISGALRARLTSSSIHAQREIIIAGGGLGVLPIFLGDGLVRVLQDDVRLMRRFWVSTHREVAGTARVRALRRWLQDLVQTTPPRLASPTK
ncbi:MAG TPA: LysR family transcriptional regulator [Caulobacteraceae bacterium]|jgi:DNA-binding transcriptional LysR family regulator|nr:LysR family transcriptional regulator [Caulobacteraceae bacterium]